MIRDIKELEEYKDAHIVIIPYVDNEAQGGELECAIAGWKQFYNNKTIVVVVGDYHYSVEREGVMFISMPRTFCSDVMCNKHLEFAKAIREVRKYFPKHMGFLLASDDEYIVKPMSKMEARCIKRKAMEFDGDPLSRNAWERDMYRTRALLDDEGFPHGNYCTHTPYYMSFDTWEELAERYDIFNTSYVIENLYYNAIGTTYAISVGNKSNKYRYVISDDTETEESIRKAFKTSSVVFNTIEGYSPMLIRLLREHYNLK